MRRIRINRSLHAKLTARELRSNMSVSEKWFWSAVRKDVLGFRFRRQYRIGPYFLDFYVPAARLCVEVDGEQHALRADKDSKRDEYLAQFGILTVRVPSLDLFRRDHDKFVAWLVEIRSLCASRAGSPPPAPSSRKRKEGVGWCFRQLPWFWRWAFCGFCRWSSRCPTHR